MRPLAFVDLETTGSNASLDRITEIGIILVDDDAVEEWNTLVNPGCRISGFIQSLTGISNDMVADAPDFAALAPRVQRLLEGRLFVAHNARFDYGFLKQSFRRAGQDFSAPTLCTVRLSRALFPGHRHHNLDALIERHGLVATERHRALADARLIHQFWQHARAALSEAGFEATLRRLTAHTNLPAQLPQQLPDELPERCGVYIFHGEDDRALYVGKSRNIRQRVLAHFSGDVRSARAMRLTQQVRRIDWIETGGEIGALLQEALLVKSLQPTHNQRLRRTTELCSVTLADGPLGLRTAVTHARDLDFSQSPSLYGLFQGARQAQTALVKLADDHQLCKQALGLEAGSPGRSCFARQLDRCRGVCVGEEPTAQHSIRLMEALGRLKLQMWPFTGPAYLREGRDLHLVSHWAYLGTARSQDELHQLLAVPEPRFDRDCYRILRSQLRRLVPLPPRIAARGGDEYSQAFA
jgi:DNA polymerase-3 subunit epsilon